MPKNKPHTDKVKDLKEFVKLTWEVVRRNQKYREDYVKFLQGHNLTPREAKPRIRGRGRVVPWHPARHGEALFDVGKGRFIWEDDAPDPERCNLSFMLQKWGFACDPGLPTPQGPSWRSAFISKDWIESLKKSGPFGYQPLLTEKRELQKLPGVLEVGKWPEVRLNEDRVQKMNEVANMVMAGWKPQTNQEYQEYLEAVKPCQWEINNPNLTVTINLEAPSYLAIEALEVLLKLCKANLGIKEKKIEEKHILKCLEIHDIHQKGGSPEEITQRVKLTHYKKDEAEADKEEGSYNKDWGNPQIRRCIEDAKEMIDKGSII